MDRICSSCRIPKSLENFRKNKASKDGLHSTCNECNKAIQRRWYQNNKEKAIQISLNYYKENQEKVQKRRKIFREVNSDSIKSKRKIHYHANKPKFKEYSWRKAGINLTYDEYLIMLVKQDHSCAICKNKGSAKKVLSVDHCHNTGKIRGLLCDNCNRALGYLKDDVNLLETAIKYLAHG